MTPVLAEAEQANVRAAFVAWAARQAGAPHDVESLIEGIEESEEHIGLLATDIQGRQIVSKEVPIGGRARVTVPAVSRESIDPWDAEPKLLRERSEHVAICAACAGEGKMACARCAGRGKLLCGGCDGRRKAYGYAANGSYRLLKCKACNGKGEVDCDECHRGVATCARCAGEGRLQRWLEIEWWRRSVAGAHRAELARQLGWSDDPPQERIVSDADPIVAIDRPHRLTATDLGGIPVEWLSLLAPPLGPNERVSRQRLRILRVPQSSVRYRIGSDEDSILFSSRRLVGSPDAADSPFAWRASRLRTVTRLLVATAAVMVIAALGRGPFYRSTLTLISLAAAGAALATAYGAAVDWTSARRHTRRWLLGTGSCLLVAVVLTIAALPRRAHAERLVRDGALDAAEEELVALNTADAEPLWADLRLARVRQATDIGAARHALAQIPRELPQYGLAVAAVDDLIMLTAVDAMRSHRPVDAAAALTLLSDRAERQPQAVAVAISVFLPLARRKIAQKDWDGAEQNLVAARRIGVPRADLQPAIDAIRTAGVEAARRAREQRDPLRRLRAAQDAERILVAWEKTSGSWGTPPLIALRTAMARDLAAAEKVARRRSS
jgi:hypothetical protein